MLLRIVAVPMQVVGPPWARGLCLAIAGQGDFSWPFLKNELPKQREVTSLGTKQNLLARRHEVVWVMEH